MKLKNTLAYYNATTVNALKRFIAQAHVNHVYPCSKNFGNKFGKI
jgi:hypothetical protein